ncbi:Uncharacterised protein [Bordetella pertussis]|nr:Uncharacterised protein [Bordetella pertussis]
MTGPISSLRSMRSNSVARVRSVGRLITRPSAPRRVCSQM